MSEKGIAWPGEGEKYQNTHYTADQVAVPPFWIESYPGGYTNSGLPDIGNNEHFWVWMRTAGLPTFRKLWQRNDDEDMQEGTYSMQIFMSASVPRSRFFFFFFFFFYLADECYRGRLPRGSVLRQEEHRVQHDNMGRWAQSVPRHRLHCRRRSLRPDRRRPYAATSDQAEEDGRHAVSQLEPAIVPPLLFLSCMCTIVCCHSHGRSSCILPPFFFLHQH